LIESVLPDVNFEFVEMEIFCNDENIAFLFVVKYMPKVETVSPDRTA
jgi:hypothetical protein